MATDYDCWHPHNEKVNVELALKTFRENVGKVTQVLCAAVPIIAKIDWTEKMKELKVIEQKKGFWFSQLNPCKLCINI